MAKVVYDIKTEVGMPTPAYDTDVEETVKSEEDSDVSVDDFPITTALSAPSGDVESSPIVSSESSPHEERDPLAEVAWPPRVLDSYPFTLLIMGKEKVPLFEEPGSPGAVISLASTASDTVALEPITTPEDEAAIAMCDRQIVELFAK